MKHINDKYESDFVRNYMLSLLSVSIACGIAGFEYYSENKVKNKLAKAIFEKVEKNHFSVKYFAFDHDNDGQFDEFKEKGLRHFGGKPFVIQYEKSYQKNDLEFSRLEVLFNKKY